MSDPNADFKTLLDLTGGVQVRSAEHPDDRRQRHRLEVNAIRLIGAIAAFSALILGMRSGVGTPGRTNASLIAHR
jgi:hypothetical protein